jgi:hypothetical protein
MLRQSLRRPKAISMRWRWRWSALSQAIGCLRLFFGGMQAMMPRSAEGRGGHPSAGCRARVESEGGYAASAQG